MPAQGDMFNKWCLCFQALLRSAYASDGAFVEFHNDQFIYQELAPSLLGWGLLALRRACLSALLYKSMTYRFEGQT